MIKKLDEEFLEYQTKLNLSEIYNNDEIKLLKESIPDLNNFIYLVSNNDINNSNNSKSFIDKNNQPQYQYRYFSSSRKIKNNSNTSVLIDKEKFYSLILDTIKNYFQNEQKFLLSKSISLLIDEIMNISKIIKQNLIYNEFFKSIKNTKLTNFSKNKDKNKEYKNTKVRFNTKDLKNKSTIITNRNTNENIPNLKNYPKEKDINNNINVKKQLSFETENERQKKNINNNRCNKSAFEKKIKEKKIKDFSSRKDKDKDKSKIISTSKINQSVSKRKNKKLNNNKIKINIFKRNISSMNTSTTQTKNKPLINHNPIVYNNNISLKKSLYDIKLGISDILNNKNEFSLTENQNIKKISKDERHRKNNVNNNKQIIINSPIDINFNLYKDIETQEFNIFKLEAIIGRELILPLIGYYVFNIFGFDQIFKYNIFENWCKKIAEGYHRNNFYHNDLHAADVTQTCLLYIKIGNDEDAYPLSIPNISSIFLSCLCHDYQHPGVNNNFLKETKNKLSIRYNDISILENMHISATFKLILNNKDCNIFDNVDNNLYKQMRKEMISCVLATDMTFHNQYVDFLKENLNYLKDDNIKRKDNKKHNEDYHQKFMNLLIHSADISNPTKKFKIYFEWAKLVVEEFWDQGDKEKDLHLPCSCDREKVTIYQSQLGFINFIEIPYFSLFAVLNPKLKFFYDNLINNKNILLSMQEKEKEKKKYKDE